MHRTENKIAKILFSGENENSNLFGIFLFSISKSRAVQRGTTFLKQIHKCADYNLLSFNTHDPLSTVRCLGRTSCTGCGSFARLLASANRHAALACPTRKPPAQDGVVTCARPLWYRCTYPPGVGGSPSAPMLQLHIQADFGSLAALFQIAVGFLQCGISLRTAAIRLGIPCHEN